MWLLLVACRHYEGELASECADRLDNDGDGESDCEDAGCAGRAECDPTGVGVDPTDTSTDSGLVEETDSLDDSDTVTDTDVDTDTGPATECVVASDGSAVWTNLQEAVDAAAPGDEITICPGVYEGVTLDFDVALTGVGADVQLTAPDSSETGTILSVNDANVSVRNVTFAHAASHDVVRQAGGSTVFEWVVFEGNWFAPEVTGDSGVLVVENGDVVVRHSVFWDNLSDSMLRVKAGNFDVRNTIFGHNVSGREGTLATFAGAEGVFDNNVLEGNTTLWGGPLIGECSAPVRNTIIANNLTDKVIGSGRPLEYCVLWQNGSDQADEAHGTLVADPKFKRPASRDYTLQTGSAAIDKGDPRSRYNDADATRNDIGAYGGPYSMWP